MRISENDDISGLEFIDELGGLGPMDLVALYRLEMIQLAAGRTITADTRRENVAEARGISKLL